VVTKESRNIKLGNDSHSWDHSLSSAQCPAPSPDTERDAAHVIISFAPAHGQTFLVKSQKMHTKIIFCIFLITFEWASSSVPGLKLEYYYNDTRMPWQDAAVSCNMRGATLAKIETPSEYQLAALAVLTQDEDDFSAWMQSSVNIVGSMKDRVWIGRAEVSGSKYAGDCLSLSESRLLGYSVSDALIESNCNGLYGVLCASPTHSEMVADYDFIYDDRPLSWSEASAACNIDGGIITPIDSLVTALKASLLLTNASIPCSWIEPSTFSSSAWSGMESLAG
jgi:hypothetical protein